MKILNLSLDRLVLDNNSSVAKRIVGYGNLVDKYTVLVPNIEEAEKIYSDKVKVIGVKACCKMMVFIKIYQKAKKLLKNNKYDVISVQDQYFFALIGWLLSRKFKVGLEIQVHGFEKYYGLRKLITNYALPRADALRVVSRRLKKQMISEFRVKEEIITVVPIYVNIANKREFEANKSKLNDKIIFLTIGRLVLVKNIELQIRAMAEVLKQHPKIELWIVGEGSKKEELEKEIKKVKLENNVKLYGWQNNLEKFYNQADVFMLTSNSEGWGIAVVEAASYGLPIIMTDVGCAGEIIKNNESGIVIPIDDQKSLEQAMEKLINNKDLRKKLGDNAREAIKKLSTKEETLNLYKKSWEKAIKKL